MDFLKKLGLFCLKNIISFLFATAVLYYAFQAYVLETDVFLNKLIMFVIIALWGLWLLVRHMAAILLVLIVLGGAAYGWHLFSTRDARACEEAGKVWNEENQICEDKKTFLQKIEAFINKYFSSAEG